MPVLPMFPLGVVLVPGMVLPLHVFEPRYRQMVRDCLAGAGELGVVLIERGSEVGGGEQRTDLGTAARIVGIDQLPDGRFLLATVGIRRIRVKRWLEDRPYPRAEVADWPEQVPAGWAEEAPESLRELQALVRRVAALRTELGEPAPAVDVELADDPVLGVYHAVAVSPLGPLDRQALLAAPTLDRRVALLRDLLTDQLAVLEARLGGR